MEKPQEIKNIIRNPIKNVERIRCGYTNEVYLTNDEYVLKICTNEKNYQNFKRASLFCGKYFEKINCPQILFSNLDIEHNNVWRLEKKVKGEILFYKWDDFSQIERQNILKKICDEQINNLNGRLSIYAIKQYLGLLSVTQEPKKIILELEDLISCKDIIKNRENVIEERSNDY